MEVKINSAVLSLVKGDITEETTDAIVNAANSRLAGGGGVDGAIHRKGGHDITRECRAIGICPTGSAVITGGGKLKARYVIHTVGPVYRDGSYGEDKFLKSAYKASIAIAAEKGFESISFPSISTGAYGYPVEDASVVALETVIDCLKENKGLKLVRFVLFSDKDFDIYKRTLDGLLKQTVKA